MIPLREQEYIREVFEQALTGPVKIEFFTQRPVPVFVPGREECRYCEDIHTMLDELAALSSKLTVRVHELAESSAEAKRYGVTRVPATVLRGVVNRPIMLYGIPAGTLFPVLIEVCVAVSTGQTAIEPGAKRRLKRVKRDVQVELFTTPEDPYGADIARVLASLALENSHLRLTIVEATEFSALAQERGVESVPLTLIDRHIRLEGAVSPADLLDQIVKASETVVAAPARLPGGAVSLGLPQAGNAADAETRPSGLIIPRR